MLRQDQNRATAAASGGGSGDKRGAAMRDSADEGSPLLGGGAGPAPSWGDAGRKASAGRTPRRAGGEVRGKSTRSRSSHPASAAFPKAAFLRRKWRASAGVAGILVLSMALAGLAGVFSAMKGERIPSSSSAPLQMNPPGGENAAGGENSPPASTTAAAAPESRERCETRESRARMDHAYAKNVVSLCLGWTGNDMRYLCLCPGISKNNQDNA